jgi:DNA-binding Xre family transcriptional regulator
MICGSHAEQFAETATASQDVIADYALENNSAAAHNRHMLSSEQLIELLSARNIPKNEIAKTLGRDNSAVSRMFGNARSVKLDEAKALVERFDLQAPDSPPLSPLSLPVARLLILYAADRLGLSLDPADPRVEELAQDFRAFSRFAADPQVRENADAAAGFLQGVRLGRDPTA